MTEAERFLAAELEALLVAPLDSKEALDRWYEKAADVRFELAQFEPTLELSSFHVGRRHKG